MESAGRRASRSRPGGWRRTGRDTSSKRHDFDPTTGVIKDEWRTIDLRERAVTVERMQRRVTLFPDFVERLGRYGFALSDTWGQIDGTPVTSTSRLYALFDKVCEAAGPEGREAENRPIPSEGAGDA